MLYRRLGCISGRTMPYLTSYRLVRGRRWLPEHYCAKTSRAYPSPYKTVSTYQQAGFGSRRPLKLSPCLSLPLHSSVEYP